MKATGIVRRIDDLGRVVIPKEIRRTMRLREGDPLEIYTDRDGEVIFKKYSPIGELNGFAAEYAETLQKTAGMPIFICDRDAVIAVSGASKREYLDRKISRALEEDGSHYVSSVMPIIAEGDITGAVIAGWQYDMPTTDKLQDIIESKLIQTAGLFLAKQIEG